MDFWFCKKNRKISYFKNYNSMKSKVIGSLRTSTKSTYLFDSFERNKKRDNFLYYNQNVLRFWCRKITSQQQKQNVLWVYLWWISRNHIFFISKLLCKSKLPFFVCVCKCLWVCQCSRTRMYVLRCTKRTKTNV